MTGSLLPQTFDNKTRPDLICSALLPRRGPTLRHGSHQLIWLRTDHLIESAHIWLRNKLRAVD